MLLSYWSSYYFLMFINFDIKTFMTKRAFRTLVSLSMQLNTKRPQLQFAGLSGREEMKIFNLLMNFLPCLMFIF